MQLTEAPVQISSLLDRFAEPETLKMAKLGRELRAKGIDIIDLSLGEPDFDTPQHIKEAAKKAIDDNWSHYPPVAGYPDLREAICQKFKRDNNLDYKQENIVVSTGAKQSLANAILALVDVGDEVIIPAPFWVTYSELVKIAGGIPVIVRTPMENKYKISPQQLEEVITERSKVFLFSSPCNPSGTVYTKDELKELADTFEKHPGISIISDEIYEYINFIGKHESIAQFENIKDRVIIVNGVSKGYAMTGWRIGYIGAPKFIADACDKMQGQFTSAASSIAQKAAEAALTMDMKPTYEMQQAFRRRRDLVLDKMKDIPGIKINKPEGAFYVFPDVSAYFGKSFEGKKINNASELCMYLLHQAHVSLVTGDAFGDGNCVRFSYAAADDKLVEAIKRIKTALSKLS